jgi:flagellar hook assembly protein FlgD
VVVTDGTHSLNKIAYINGDYAIVSSVATNSEGMIPLVESQVSDFSVSNAYPNPFNPSTSIELDLNRDAFVSINIYNIAGQLVDQVFSGNLSNSNHRFTWDASLVSSGVYFMNIQVDDQLETKKLMLVK